MIFRLLVLLLLGFIAWRMWRGWLLAQGQQQGQRPPPPEGSSHDSDPLVRCDRCGVRVPGSQLAAVRANCKLCGQDR